MEQDRLIRFDGIVIAALPEGRYRVRFPNGHEIVADCAIPDSEPPDVGDGITVEISPDDTSVGRLFFRRTTPAGER